MGRVVGSVLAVVLLGLALSGPAAAKQVYLKDGGIIDCQSFRQVNGKVVVQVNRDVVVDLSRDEVDMKRTFPAKAVKKAKKHVKTKRKALAQPAAKSAESGVPPKAPGQPGPAAKQAPPVAKPAAPAPPAQPGKPAPAPKPAGAPNAKAPVAAAVVKPPAPSAQATSPAPPAKPAAGNPAQPTGPKPGSQPAPAAGAPNPAVPAPNAAPVPPLPARKPIPLRQEAPKPAAAALGAMMGTSVLVPFLLLLLICIVSFWKVFEKAGEAGWKCLIPIYNLFVLVKISGKPWWWFLLLFVPVVNIIFSVLMNLALAGRFGKSQLFGVGLCFFGFIFFPILAFDKSTYS